MNNFALHEYYSEIEENGLLDTYNLIVYKSKIFLSQFKTISTTHAIEFADFYDFLDDDLKVKIQFSSALKKALQENFIIYKEDHQFAIAMKVAEIKESIIFGKEQ